MKENNKRSEGCFLPVLATVCTVHVSKGIPLSKNIDQLYCLSKYIAQRTAVCKGNVGHGSTVND